MALVLASVITWALRCRSVDEGDRCVYLRGHGLIFGTTTHEGTSGRRWAL